MSKERDERSGRYVEKATLDDVLETFDAVDGPPVVTTADVADETGISRDSARRKLETLRDRGRVEKRKSAGRVLYWRVADEQTPSERREPAERREQSDEGRDMEQPTPDETHTTSTEHTPESARLDDVVEGLDTTPDRRAAVRACVEHLREHGTSQKSRFVDAVYSEHPASYNSPGGWWNKIGKEHLQTVADEYGPVESPPKEGSHTWRWDATNTSTDQADDPLDESGPYDPTVEFDS